MYACHMELLNFYFVFKQGLYYTYISNVQECTGKVADPRVKYTLHLENLGPKQEEFSWKAIVNEEVQIISVEYTHIFFYFNI